MAHHRVERVDGTNMTDAEMCTMFRERGSHPCGCRLEYYVYNYPVKDPTKRRKARYLPGTRVWLWDLKWKGDQRVYTAREGVVTSIDACSRNDQTFYTVELTNGKRVSWRGGQNILPPGAVPNSYGTPCKGTVYHSPSGTRVRA